MTEDWTPLDWGSVGNAVGPEDSTIRWELLEDYERVMDAAEVSPPGTEGPPSHNQKPINQGLSRTCGNRFYLEIVCRLLILPRGLS